ncbi:acyclic terpene utilization AtuA family protein [Nonomuraea sp. JJY05]|uniref:acyclic terpene utilization AtuA family protein n=1 Tax=Nonomuraea sp. JJY05 TaxID=3350255 RepID=UPI00373E0C40
MTLRIANCSGFYGDRLSAAREMVEGGPIDVLTGDWLAELTMLILAGNRLKGRPGYAPTFLRQLEDVLGPCLDKSIKIVTNAGGLDPAGCAEAVHDLATRLGLSPTIAHITGDDLTGRPLDLTNADTGEPLTATPLTANAYLGGRPIATALAAGADVVVTGRVTDAALVTGPGIWRHGWGPEDLDQLAGSVVAGHVIECGCQATGGNYAFFQDVPDLAHCGFPIAELNADGSAVITKHPGTGGLVSVGTVTAQLVYELGGPRYLGPDAVARFDTITLTDDGPDRVLISGVRGEPPPDTLKVAVNYLAGYRNTMTLVLTGLDVPAKARAAEDALWARVPRDSFDRVDVELTDSGLLRITVMDADERRAGRAFSSAVVETGLASYPGFYALTPPGNATPYGVYWPVLVPASEVHPQIFLNGNPLPPAAPDAPDPQQAANAITPYSVPAPEAPRATEAPPATKVTSAAETARPTEATGPVETARPTETPGPAETTRATRAAETADVAQAIGAAQAVKAAGDVAEAATPHPAPALLPAPGRREAARSGSAPANGDQVAELPTGNDGQGAERGGEELRPPGAGQPSVVGPRAGVRVPLGWIAGARSGDKGGNANLGVWTDTRERYDWLAAHLTPDTLKRLLPVLAPHRVDRYELPNIKALNFVIHGLLGRGVAASPRMDPQAKALGEELRAKEVDIPPHLRD